ncbi:MAG: hypothetical protein IMZ65_00740 [Planctomycetes bacterium]|nr:hypothetical protein [Planctomycetota bacterium]
MLALIAAALWLRPASLEFQAEAKGASGLGKAGLDGAGAMIGQLEALNQRLAGIEQGLRDGSFTIQATEPQGAAKAAAKAPAKESK